VRLIPGTRLGPYEIESAIGAGGMGEVYRARDVRLNRHVAVKVIRGDAADARTRERFMEEAKAASALNHPHIVTVHDVGSDTAGDFIIMELVEGTPLDREIAGRPMPVSRALRLAIQLTDAMRAAHQAGIVHRDFKPANIVIGHGDSAKVLDFGVARLVDAQRTATLTSDGTAAGSIAGTFSYMAPEQAQGQAVDARADIFAFGAVLYEMLTGRAAFARDSAFGSVAAVIHESPPPLRDLVPGLPADLERLVERCMRKDRTRRVQTMADLHVALQDLADHLATASPAIVLEPQVSHRRTALWVGGALTAAAIILAVVFAWKSDDPAGDVLPVLTRMTTDNGFTVDPAVSPDGTLLAYASERSGNLDIWIQRIAGGAPIRLTTDSFDERQPSFSPDGTQVVFRSERDAGGLYIVSALGGQQPRLLVPAGRDPHYSPDGRSIAYWTGPEIGFGNAPGSYRTFIIPAAGGIPRAIEGFTGIRFPVWSPDSKRLIAVATTARASLRESYDWWLIPVDGGEPLPMHAGKRMTPAGISAIGTFGPSSWQDGRLLFSDNRSLYSFEIDDQGRLADTPRRLTTGTTSDSDPSAGPNGLIAFTSGISEGGIWALPLDDEAGVATGPPQRITQGAGPYGRPSPSADGSVVAYRLGLEKPTLHIKNLLTGGVMDLGAVGEAFGSSLSPDGQRIAYREGNGVKVVPVQGGVARLVCDRCALGDWLPDSRQLVVTANQGVTDRFLVIGVDTASMTSLLTDTAPTIDRPHPSPDGKWIAFRRYTDAGSQVLVAPVAVDQARNAHDGVAATAPERDARPCGWSASSRTVYFVSSRDGNRCLYAQRLDGKTGIPEGPPTAVMHLHNARNFRAGQSGVLSTGTSNAVRGGKFFYDQFTIAADIWTLRLATPARPRVQVPSIQ
jgi:Tol biopolymer transport system component